jgi:hypothetical protein
MTSNLRFTITESRQSESHRKSSNGARSRRRKENPAETRYHGIPTEFICIDGEGVTLPNGLHRYVLVGIADQQITNPNGLGWEEIFDFLWEQFLEHGTKSVAYVGFFLGYDFVQWFKTFPEERARMLLTKEGRAKRQPKNKHRVQPFPVRYGDYEFDILGNKRFRLRKVGESRWMSICDTGPFFQKSFMKVIDPEEWSDPIVTAAEYDILSTGKAGRSTAILDTNMLRYNALENEILSRVLCRLNQGFQTLGINLRPNQWFGPGQAAQEWLKDRAITAERLQEIIPQEVLEHARESYFGGWFEIMAHGHIPGITYEYDINSAYPYIISQLPCLEHGQWIHGRDPYIVSETEPYTLVYARVEGDNRWIGAMLHRDDKGNIYRPHKTEGWYWLHELDAAKRAGLISGDPVVLDSWSYDPCDCSAPFREVRDIYELRKSVGKKTPLGIACKLVPNSLYGKFAQSIGHPKFANPIYASLITAGCRTMILNAIATHPMGAAACVMVATDGVYFKKRHPNLPISGELGDWDAAEKRHLTQFKPGVYWDDSTRTQLREGKAPVFKARGVNAKDFGAQIDRIDGAFHAMELSGWPQVTFPVEFAMISAVQALARNNWALAGTIIEDAELTHSANPHGKRNPRWFIDREMGVYRTTPRVNEPYEPSHPYEKRFGMEDPWSQEMSENWGVTPDGLPAILINEALQLK